LGPGVALYFASLAVTSISLALVGAFTTSFAAQLTALLVTWSLAAAARFILIGSIGNAR
jgi:hypothetical protein